jgi:putative FmdB family regulatory protein
MRYALGMPLYEFLCPKCGARDEVFTRRIQADVPVPACPQASKETGHDMKRVVSKFARHRTVADQLVEAEARWGKEVDAAMGAEPDVGKYARRYESLSKNLPKVEDA